MKLRTVAALSFLSLTACIAAPIASSPTNNADIEVEQLFTHDGCAVYRFRDGGYHYYVRCNTGTAQTMTPKGCGKNCVRDEVIATTP
jgi:hypothetical protein